MAALPVTPFGVGQNDSMSFQAVDSRMIESAMMPAAMCASVAKFAGLLTL